MYPQKKYLLFFLILLLAVTGCDENNKKEKDAYIGGKIVNPTSKNVIILKDNKPLDTILLDQNNRFSHTLKNAETGLYVFKHLPESQVFFLEPGDSLLIRTNSIDFDESFHFSGIGHEKNNFLTRTILENEKNTALVLSYYKINPEKFSDKADSIQLSQLNFLRRASKKYKFPKEFTALAEKSIQYDCYDLKERYTYMVNKYYKKFSKQMPQDFHSYRDKVDYNDAKLQTSPSYIRFIENYSINMSMAECAVANLDNNNCYDLYDHRNITTRIQLIDSLTTLPLIKDHFFSKFGAVGIIMAKKREEIAAILELLKEKKCSEEQLAKLTRTGNLQLAYLPGMNVQNVTLTASSGREKKFSEIVSKPTIVFLWSIYFPENHQENHETIKELSQKYPEITFLGINMDAGEIEQWRKILTSEGYDKATEFQINYKLEQEIFQNYLNKSLFIDRTGEVVTGDAYINSPNFESKILEFLNQ